MKRWISAGLLLVSGVILFLVSSRSLEQVSFAALRITQEELTRIEASRKETDADLIRSIRFNNVPLFFDENTSGWFYSVTPEKPDTNPAINFTAASRQVKAAFAGDIEPGKTIGMIAYDDDEFREYKLVVTPLPLIRIECEDSTFPPTEMEEDLAVSFTLIDNRADTLQPVVQSDGRFHIRGRGSSYYEKKSFKLTLFQKSGSKEQHENPTSLLGLRPDGDWLLYAGYNDQEKIRNVFSSNLWFASCGPDNSFGLQNGNEYRFAELFMNQSYWGLYAIGYPIDAAQMQITPNMRGEYEEFIFTQSVWLNMNRELRNYGDARLEVEMDVSSAEADYGFSILKQYFEYLMDGAVYGLDHNDGDNAIDIWLFLNLIQAEDSINPGKGLINNVIYTIKSTDGGKKILYTPWDMDRSWGNIIDFDAPNTTRPYALKPDNNQFEMKFNPVSMMQERDPSINLRIKARYADLRADQWSDDTVSKMISSFEQDIFASGAYLREMERWPDGSYIDPDLGLSLFRDYVLKRFQALDTYVDALPVPE